MYFEDTNVNECQLDKIFNTDKNYIFITQKYIKEYNIYGTIDLEKFTKLECFSFFGGEKS